MMRCMHLIKNEFARCLKTWIFVLCAAGLFLTIMYSCVAYLIIDTATLKEGLPSGYHLEAILTGMRSDAVTFFLPICSSLIYAGIYLDERGYGFLKAYLPRCGRKNYVRTKIITAACSGGLCVVVAMVAAAAILTIKLMPFETLPIKDGATLPQVLLAGGNLVLEGMLWGTVGTLFAIIYADRYMAYGGAFLTSNILIIIVTRYLPKAYILNPREWTELAGKWAGIKGLSFIFLAAVTAVIMWVEKRVLTGKIESIG